ncbi:MAG TPA: aspartate aminotransferase family protein [Acidimicrobiales bacterium]
MGDGALPDQGLKKDELLARLDEMRAGDADWRSGRTFSLVYNLDDDEHEEALEEVAIRFLHENALNPFKFPSLVQMDQEVVSAAGHLLHAPDPRHGKLTSGGTESLFLAVQSARDWARNVGGIAEPNLVTPITAHPALAKAAHYLDIEQRKVGVGPSGRVDPDSIEAAMDSDTALIVGSAPNYPFGVIDPIPELGEIAQRHGTLLHVDGCLGGWLLPFWEELGERLPCQWDFRVPGVTSISADVHKYGYAYKGASVIIYRDKAVLEQQYFLYDEWPGGLYGSATTAGTRSASPIAGAWAATRLLGHDGYLAATAKVRDAFHAFIEGIEAIEGLVVTGTPDVACFEFGSDRYDIAAIGDVMDDRGWHLDRQQGGLHLIVFPFHTKIVPEFLDDLAHAVTTHGESRGTAAVYGAVGD